MITITNADTMMDLLDEMVELGFVSSKDKDVVRFTLGSSPESWFSNGVVEFKLLYSPYDGFKFFNFRNLDHPHIAKLEETISK